MNIRKNKIIFIFLLFFYLFSDLILFGQTNNKKEDNNNLIIEEIDIKNDNIKKMNNNKHVKEDPGKNFVDKSEPLFGKARINDLGLLEPQINFYYFLYLFLGVIFIFFIHILKKKGKTKFF